MEGTMLRVRPKALTVAVTVAGLFPIMTGQGAGSEVMQRTAAPLLSMILLPVAYLLLHRRALASTPRRP